MSLAVLLVVACGPPDLKHTAPKSASTSLRELAVRHNLHVGSAVSAGPLQGEPEYRRILLRQFNMMTPENAMKFGRLQSIPSKFDFQQADEIIATARTMNMKVRGHTLVWHRSLPLWLTEGNLNKQQLIGVLRGHIKTVVGRYRGDVVAWDVVNEAVAEDGSLRETFWLKGIGPEYIALAFKWAHEADPDALLFYNDYGGEGLGIKSNAIYDLLEKLLASGVPIHGIGLQTHLGLEDAFRIDDVEANMARLARLGLEIHITEMDVRIVGEMTEQNLTLQAQVYRNILKTCLEQKNCTAFVVWGATDAHSWVPVFFEGSDHALLFDKQYRPKPAYRALIEVLALPQTERMSKVKD